MGKGKETRETEGVKTMKPKMEEVKSSVGSEAKVSQWKQVGKANRRTSIKYGKNKESKGSYVSNIQNNRMSEYIENSKTSTVQVDIVVGMEEKIKTETKIIQKTKQIKVQSEPSS